MDGTWTEHGRPKANSCPLDPHDRVRWHLTRRVETKFCWQTNEAGDAAAHEVSISTCHQTVAVPRPIKARSHNRLGVENEWERFYSQLSPCRTHASEMAKRVASCPIRPTVRGSSAGAGPGGWG